ncbi:hypothetical protein [Klebsiella quasivariicola]|uniref:hypothetical protein n=1 Tax=Klebsiella quasivariicola TaxID=2026240 RepID=UPI002478B91E|nr:hypothetical protein [Klebsiella quasivariicola]
MLKFQVEPDDLVVSTGEHRIRNALLLTVTHDDSEPIIFSVNKALLMMLPLMPAGRRRKVNDNEITLSAPDGWKVERSQSDKGTWYWRCYPLQPITFERGEHLIFLFNELYIHHADYPAGTLSFLHVGVEAELPIFLPLILKHSEQALTAFLPGDTVKCGIGDNVKLAWRISGDIYEESSEAWLMPGNLDAQEASSVIVQPRQSTTYMLYARQCDRVISRQQEVFVSPGKIKKFQASVKDEQSVKLFAELENSDHAWLDNGIGRVTKRELQAGVAVFPDKYQTTYTLMCEQNDGFSTATCVVTLAHKLTVKNFSVTPCSTVLPGMYEIRWQVVNAVTVTLICDNEELSQQTQGTIYMLLPGTTKLLCTGEKGQECEISVTPTSVMII